MEGKRSGRAFRLYIHRTEGIPGVDAGSCRSQSAIFRVADGVITGALSELPGRLHDGLLKIADTVLDNMIPIPLDYAGEIELRLEQWSDILWISGTHIKLDLIGEATYVEEFPGQG